MKYLKLFENHQTEVEIVEICDKYNILDYNINKDGSVDVNDENSIYLSYRGLKKLPLKFGHINGYFRVAHNNLTTLEGAPHTVSGNFDCSNNKLTSLEFAPKSVNGNFWCANNNIRSFEGLVDIRGNLHCQYNPVEEIWDIINPIDNYWDSEKMEFFNDLDIIRGEEIAIDRFNFFLEEMGLSTVEKVEGYKNIY